MLNRARVESENRIMGRRKKLLTRILARLSDANIPFEQTRTLLNRMGFSERIVGSHHILAREDVHERPNLQPTREGMLKLKPPEEDRFEIDIFWSDEDGAYIALVPAIPSCTAWGETYEEALTKVRTAIRGNIEVAREFDHPIPQPRARQVS